jgi:hypothetical protein
MPGRVRRRRLQLLQVGPFPKRHGRKMRVGPRFRPAQFPARPKGAMRSCCQGPAGQLTFWQRPLEFGPVEQQPKISHKAG